MERVKRLMGPIIRTSFLIMIIGGVLYPAAITVIAQVIIPDRANGSLIYNGENEVIGSELIGQNFTSAKFFHGRVSSIKYDASGSGSNNYGPSNQEMIERLKESAAAWEKDNPNTPLNKVPLDLVTNSGSGLDPHISPDAAYAQVSRVSEMTGINQQNLIELISKNTQGKELGIFGEERVNVLKLNLDLVELL
ncbi:potassium-transporting ATPase subunit KdpC [Cytobacillus horneckiae]|uniref:potassium-transporting ATPase subunit KdpC n=1 Tax=Cytobacillus horneckiae TaxID=549687 RepID=UPI0034CE550F